MSGGLGLSQCENATPQAEANDILVFTWSLGG